MASYTQDQINAFVSHTGKSRATIYRWINLGWTEVEIMAGKKGVTSYDLPAPEPDQIDAPPDDFKFAVTWAQAVLWAADNVDTPKKQMTKQRAGSALRYNLYLLGKDDLRELHVNLVPKALNILDKNQNPEGTGVAALEEKNANELLDTLKQALEESGRQWVERN